MLLGHDSAVHVDCSRNTLAIYQPELMEVGVISIHMGAILALYMTGLRFLKSSSDLQGPSTSPECLPGLVPPLFIS